MSHPLAVAALVALPAAVVAALQLVVLYAVALVHRDVACVRGTAALAILSLAAALSMLRLAARIRARQPVGRAPFALLAAAVTLALGDWLLLGRTAPHYDPNRELYPLCDYHGLFGTALLVPILVVAVLLSRRPPSSSAGDLRNAPRYQLRPEAAPLPLSHPLSVAVLLALVGALVAAVQLLVLYVAAYVHRDVGCGLARAAFTALSLAAALGALWLANRMRAHRPVGAAPFVFLAAAAALAVGVWLVLGRTAPHYNPSEEFYPACDYHGLFGAAPLIVSLAVAVLLSRRSPPSSAAASRRGDFS